ncbi:MAG: DNA recombination protein RmuC [Candidatus Acidiferrales bacterium]
MNALMIGAAILLAALVLWLVLQSSQDQKKSAMLESQLSELRRELQTIATSQAQSAGKVDAIGQSVTQRLDNVSKALQDGVKDSANISAQSQTAVRDEIKNSREMMERIQKQLGEVQLAGQQMSQTAQTLETILGGAKSRGTLGEVTLERLLEDALPKERYKRQYRFSSGEAADAVIFLRDKMLPIDSKFPLDAFRRMGEKIHSQGTSQAPAQADEARRAFATAVKGHADTTAKKYILPNEGTLGIALMFVPSESVYYELLMTTDAKSVPLDEYCRSKNVIAVSPNTLYAHLQVILMGLQGMQIEENAKRLHASLAGLQKQMENFTDAFGKLGTHLKNAQQSYGEADKRFDKAQNTLGEMLGGSSGEAALSDSEATLSLPAESSAKQSA